MSDIMSITVEFNSTVVTTMHKVGKKKVEEKTRVSTVLVGDKTARVSGSLIDVMKKVISGFEKKGTDPRYLKTSVEVRVLLSVPEMQGLGEDVRKAIISAGNNRFRKFVLTARGKEVICGAGHLLQIKK